MYFASISSYNNMSHKKYVSQCSTEVDLIFSDTGACQVLVLFSPTPVKKHTIQYRLFLICGRVFSHFYLSVHYLTAYATLAYLKQVQVWYL